MSIYKLSGKTIPPDTAFCHEGIQYPANWLRLATSEERSSIGITVLEEQARPDDAFYLVGDNGDGTYSKTPKDLSAKKSELVAQFKRVAGAILANTDWKVVRSVETGKPVDTETGTYRTLVRNTSDGFEASVNACQTITELAALKFNWPVAPWDIAPVAPVAPPSPAPVVPEPGQPSMLLSDLPP